MGTQKGSRLARTQMQPTSSQISGRHVKLGAAAVASQSEIRKGLEPLSDNVGLMVRVVGTPPIKSQKQL